MSSVAFTKPALLPTADCSICLGHELEGHQGDLAVDDFTIDPNGHSFHTVCLRAAMPRDPRCPLCRSRVTEINGVEVPQPPREGQAHRHVGHAPREGHAPHVGQARRVNRVRHAPVPLLEQVHRVVSSPRAPTAVFYVGLLLAISTIVMAIAINPVALCILLVAAVLFAFEMAINPEFRSALGDSIKDIISEFLRSRHQPNLHEYRQHFIGA